jgi:hypothetical protein
MARPWGIDSINGRSRLSRSLSRERTDLMKRNILTLLCVAFPALAHAQVPVFIGPQSLFQWDQVGVDAATASGFSYAITCDAIPARTLSAVSCAQGAVPLVPPAATCAANAQTVLPLGTHSCSLTAASGTLVSAPSLPYAYMTMLVPVPSGLRIKVVQTFWRTHRVFVRG